jgi:hypothetical protein
MAESFATSLAQGFNNRMQLQTQNPYVMCALTLVLACYGTLAAPFPPEPVYRLLSFSLVRVFMLFLLCYLVTKNVHASFVTAAVFYYGVTFLRTGAIEFYEDRAEGDQ